MAIPVYLQQFKAAGVYRVVFDKSTMVNENSETLRLVVGYSEVGPFNCPIYVRNPQDFVKIFGNISKKLEKRGIYFHRLALQMLAMHPIICLNLKKFDNETVGGSTITTEFNANYDPIDDVRIRLEDIYDTTRFWTLDADQLIDLNSADGVTLDNYINISTTDTRANSASYFIRKASGSKVSAYNITVNDWYSDKAEEMPEYLEDFKNNLISDFFAEIYVFAGKFRSSQVLASETLKNYFMSTDIEDGDTGEYILNLRPNLYNAYGEKIDTLDALYADPLSNAIGHWVGCLIPFFKDKKGNYQSLDILFNSDQDEHKMMIAFNTDMLEEIGGSVIDISGKAMIPTSTDLKNARVKNGVNIPAFKNPLSLETIYQGTARTNLLGNKFAPVIADRIAFGSDIDDYSIDFTYETLSGNTTSITGMLYVSGIYKNEQTINILMHQVRGGADETVCVICNNASMARMSLRNLGVTNYEKLFTVSKEEYVLIIDTSDEDMPQDVKRIKLREAFDSFGGSWWYYNDGSDTYGTDIFASIIQDYDINQSAYPADSENNYMSFYGPEKIITSIRRLELSGLQLANVTGQYTDVDKNFTCSFKTIYTTSRQSGTVDGTLQDSVYGSSISFIENAGEKWEFRPSFRIHGGTYNALVCRDLCNTSLQLVLKPGDCLIADDGVVDRDDDGKVDDNDKNMYYDNVYVLEEGQDICEDDNVKYNYILVSGCPLGFDNGGGWNYNPASDGDTEGDDTDVIGIDSYYLIRIDSALNQEIGEMMPHYLEGYVYKNDRPIGTDMLAKLEWQRFILSTLNDYKGLRVGLLNKAEIDYRYVIDTFESFPQSSLKAELSLLCKDKESAFCIGNLPAVKTFVKCPYTSFTDKNGIFNPQYVVDGRNRKKPSVESFSLPTETEGASFIAFYTPLKFTDGYVDSIIPSAGLVSNLFMEKYLSRQPYYIVAGPNYGHIVANGLVGPDYNYAREELYILEPFGFNCMIYRPTFGTFINANQTAKQTPLSALSRVNVRELVIYLQDEVEKVLQSYQWEFNNATTRNAILDKANQICALIQANGGIQTYLNIMDESNNTPEIIDNEMAVLSTHIEPGFGCGKMVHELTLYRTGQMASTILES